MSFVTSMEDEDRAYASPLVLSGLLSEISVEIIVSGRKRCAIVALIKEFNAKVQFRHSAGPNNPRWRRAAANKPHSGLWDRVVLRQR